MEYWNKAKKKDDLVPVKSEVTQHDTQNKVSETCSKMAVVSDLLKQIKFELEVNKH